MLPNLAIGVPLEIRDCRPAFFQQGCIYRGSRGSLGYPSFWGIIKAEAIKRDIFEDFYLLGYPGFRKLNTPLDSYSYLTVILISIDVMYGYVLIKISVMLAWNTLMRKHKCQTQMSNTNTYLYLKE